MKRYEPKVLQTAQHDAWAEMVKDPDGEWVRAEELEELRAERDKFREVVEGIATASTNKWECDRAEFEAEFRGWAQNICRHVIARIDAPKGGAR